MDSGGIPGIPVDSGGIRGGIKSIVNIDPLLSLPVTELTWNLAIHTIS